MRLLTILLSWNRPELVKKTIESYFKHTSTTSDLIIVDNGSEDKTVDLLMELRRYYPYTIECLPNNIGGLAFNEVLDKINIANYSYIHFSENDIEYIQDWDKILIQKLNAFRDVGQISPFSPFPQTSEGEYSWEKPATLVTQSNQSIYLAIHNVGTTCVVRSELIDQGLRWTNLERKQGIRFPHDGRFSRHVKKMGWKVAFNDHYVVKNWGHTIEELQRDLDYYINNHKAKSFQRFEERLKDLGYILQRDKTGNYILKKK